MEMLDLGTLGMGTQGKGTLGMEMLGMGTSGVGTFGMGSLCKGTHGLGPLGMEVFGMGTPGKATLGMGTHIKGTLGMGTHVKGTLGLEMFGKGTTAAGSLVWGPVARGHLGWGHLSWGGGSEPLPHPPRGQVVPSGVPGAPGAGSGPPPPPRGPTWELSRGDTSQTPPARTRPSLLIGGGASFPFVDWLPPPTMNSALGGGRGSRPGITVTTGGRDRPAPPTSRKYRPRDCAGAEGMRARGRPGAPGRGFPGRVRGLPGGPRRSPTPAP